MCYVRNLDNILGMLLNEMSNSYSDKEPNITQDVIGSNLKAAA